MEHFLLGPGMIPTQIKYLAEYRFYPFRIQTYQNKVRMNKNKERKRALETK